LVLGTDDGATITKEPAQFVETYLGTRAHMTAHQVMNNVSLVSTARMSEAEARTTLMALRWPASDGRPVYPKCGHEKAYTLKSRPVFRCKQCRSDFSITSGTIFADSKVSAKDLILAACIFVGGAKDVSGLRLSRYLGCQYKSSFVLAHKMREAMQRPDLVWVASCKSTAARLVVTAWRRI